MASDQTTVSVEGDFWRLLNRITQKTGESKRRVLWEMAKRYLESKEVRAYLELRGVDVEDLFTIVDSRLGEWDSNILVEPA